MNMTTNQEQLKITLPQEQQDIVVEALKNYQDHILDLIDSGYDSQEMRWTDFDLTQLIGIFSDKDIQVDLEMDQDTHDSFCTNHGVDFPIYV